MNREHTVAGSATQLSGVREEVRSRLNIGDVIGKYVQLRRAGKGLVGLCPFHHEKSPSFNVDPQKGLYHCFGCKEGGDLFDFVMKVEGLSFPEALALLAEKAGVPLPQNGESAEDKKRRQQLELLAQVSVLAQGFFSRTLRGPEGKAAREYLVSRGVQPQTAQKFNLGFAPDRREALTRFLADANQIQAGVAAGLLGMKEQGSAYDRFRGRIMFPLSDITGKVVAFGGRALAGEPKYLNSPETLLYVKRRQLYGLHQAKESIRKQGRVVVVEGYFDCVALHQAGVDYVVASCGTALSSEHIQTLRRLAKEVYVCFDGDAAGRSAIVKGLGALQGTELPVRIVLLPEGHDPDTFVQQAGPEAFYGLLNKAMPLTDYLLENAVSQADLRSIEGRMRGVKAALPILRKLESAVERDAYIQRVSVRLGVSAQSLASEVEGRSKEGEHHAQVRHTNLGNRNTSKDFVRGGNTLPVETPRTLVEKELIRSLLHDPSGVPDVLAVLGDAPFHTEAFNVIIRCLAQGEKENSLLDTVTSAVGPEAASDLQAGEAHVTWQECVTRLRLEHMRNELEVMEEGLATLSDHNPIQYIMHISESLMAYQRWRRALREHLPGNSQAS